MSRLVAIVAHDAGGAEILSSWVSRNSGEYVYVLDGPAVQVFERKLGDCRSIPLDDAIRSAEWVLCGSGWGASLEKEAIITAKALGKKVVAYLDHWGNYKERFLEDGRCVLPDEIWVGDSYAKAIASREFPAVKISLHENPYVLDTLAQIDRLREGLIDDVVSRDILYVCEPVKEHAKKVYGDENHWGYIEDSAILYFFEHISLLGVRHPRIRIRPHPSENKDKYAWVLDKYDCDISISGEPDLLTDVIGSRIVVGCTSMAMVVGLLAGKRVVSVIPPGGKSCSLPHKEIEHLQNMVSAHDVCRYA